MRQSWVGFSQLENPGFFDPARGMLRSRWSRRRSLADGDMGKGNCLPSFAGEGRERERERERERCGHSFQRDDPVILNAKVHGHSFKHECNI
jgi:hypothetical protein